LLRHTEVGLPELVGCTCLVLKAGLDDYSRYIVAWKLCTTMRATDVTDTLEFAIGGLRL
jgi:transposase InsO family protein